MTHPSDRAGGDDRIHFKGRWRPEDRRLLEQVIRRLQQERPRRPPTRNVARWYCVAERLKSQTYFFATRVGSVRVVWARSAEKLAEKLRQDLDDH